MEEGGTDSLVTGISLPEIITVISGVTQKSCMFLGWWPQSEQNDVTASWKEVRWSGGMHYILCFSSFQNFGKHKYLSAQEIFFQTEANPNLPATRVFLSHFASLPWHQYSSLVTPGHAVISEAVLCFVFCTAFYNKSLFKNLKSIINIRVKELSYPFFITGSVPLSPWT